MRALESIPLRLFRVLETCGDSTRCALNVPRPGPSSLDVYLRCIHNTISIHGEKKSTESDIFTKKLQQRTERELEQLVDQRRRQSAEYLDDGTEDKAGVKEYGGPKGPEPTRYGDWERAGRCTDF